ncbi:hypothetical protein CLU79DRAFT_178190 [Phycomyces nitens]|nr:hypothetical protein CLU79DRAFT_178190 [Phycomyces nitens]
MQYPTYSSTRHSSHAAIAQSSPMPKQQEITYPHTSSYGDLASPRQPVSQQERAQSMSHYNHSTTHSPHPAQALSTPQQTIYTNPGDISNIVHNPAVSVPELSTTLPPLNTTILNSPSTHSPRMPTVYSPTIHNRPMDMINSRQKGHERSVWPEEDGILRVDHHSMVFLKIHLCLPSFNTQLRKHYHRQGKVR